MMLLIILPERIVVKRTQLMWIIFIKRYACRVFCKRRSVPAGKWIHVHTSTCEDQKKQILQYL